MIDDYFNGKENVLRPANAAAAIISLKNERYLMQLRDNIENIFYPGHWGVFGGAIEDNETPTECLLRELEEELNLKNIILKPLTVSTLDFRYCGLGIIERHFFYTEISEDILPSLILGEGKEMRVFGSSELLKMPRVVPYDSTAIWMHSTINKVNFR